MLLHFLSPFYKLATLMKMVSKRFNSFVEVILWLRPDTAGKILTICLFLKNFSFLLQIKSERRTLGDHFPVVDAARVNLTRFIKYKLKGH